MSFSPITARELPFCTICQDFILPLKSISKTNCQHVYHQACLQQWLNTNHNTCPLDKKKITSINGHSINEQNLLTLGEMLQKPWDDLSQNSAALAVIKALGAHFWL